LTVTKI